ncbi:hypothetical protein KR018_011871, partial [Drosophila ironensis]
MNDLNLRVAALRLCAHPKRFAELRDAVVKLPKKYASAPSEFVRQFANATTSSAQVAVVRELFYLRPNDCLLVERFLADLLFASPLKHPVRNQLTKLFSDNGLAKSTNDVVHGHTKESLKKALHRALVEMTAIEVIAISNQKEATTNARINDVVVSASTCLQNFNYGRAVLADSLSVVLPLLPMSLERYWQELRCVSGPRSVHHPKTNQSLVSCSDTSAALSPTRRNEMYLYIQNSLRLMVSLLSEWCDRLRDTHYADKMQRAETLAYQVARDGDTPWDVRSIAGLLVGHLARQKGAFTPYLTNCTEPDPDLHELPIQTAALLVLMPRDYHQKLPQALTILENILNVVQREGNVSNLLVYISKHLFTYSKSLTYVHTDYVRKILPLLQKFAMQHISSSTDTVRHMSSGLFRQVLQHGRITQQKDLFQAVYTQFEERTASLSTICLAMEQLVQVIGHAEPQEKCPSLFYEIFPKYLGHEDCVDSLFKVMMTAAYKKLDFEEWHALWFSELNSALHDSYRPRPAVEQLLTDAVKMEPKAMLFMLMSDSDLPLSSKLVAVLSVRQLADRRLKIFHKLKDEVKDALLGLDDHTRLLALRLVVETPRPSDHVTPDEGQAIEMYLKNNANNPSAHLRQLGYGLFQKVLRRLHLSLVENKKRPTEVGQSQYALLIRIMTLLARNLFRTSNYGRRWLSLHLLRDCVNICDELNLVNWRAQLPAETAGNLEFCLGDSYEGNKRLAAGLLEKVQERTDLCPSDIMNMLMSLRPPDSVTGAYQLQVYCRVRYTNKGFPHPVPREPNNMRPTELHPRTYKALQLCLQHLYIGLALARRDLAEASKVNPMYGVLFASRHLLQQLSLRELAREPVWRLYIQQLVEVCLDISDAVLPVVSSVSPEGLLPETLDQEMDQNLAAVLQKRAAGECLVDVPASPQMVLLCCWRSIKEVSLILGELAQQAPLEDELTGAAEEEEHFLISRKNLDLIGEMFLLLLAETKHRGAFEQAYVGFTLLCRRLWHSDAVRLNQLPAQWVKEAMDMVEGKQPPPPAGTSQDEVAPRKLCSTRRSAGMPFMLQALICTELKLGTHATLHCCMQRLLQVCERKENGRDEEGLAARSHALNILRALFRCSDLADLCTEFVSRGIRCAFDSLLVDEWGEKNSATLLLSALTIRVFGVERPRLDSGELHVRNRMTGRIFFTRYPELYDYFYEVLRREAEQMETGEGGEKRGQSVQLEAMLVMLSRLYPSSFEGAESSLNLCDFVPFLLTICSSNDLMTRERAALVVSNLITEDQAVEEMTRIVFDLKALEVRLANEETFVFKANHYHGQLLLLLKLYNMVRWSHPEVARIQMFHMAQLAAPILAQDICVFGALLDVMVAHLQDLRQQDQFNMKTMKQLVMVSELDAADIFRRCAEHGISMRFFQLYGLHLRRLRGNVDGIIGNLETLSGDAGGDSPATALKVELWLYILISYAHDEDITLITETDLDNFNFNSDISEYFDSFDYGMKLQIGKRLHRSQAVRSCVLQMLEARNWSLEMVGQLTALRSLLYEPEADLKTMIVRCQETTLLAPQHPGLVFGLKRLMQQQSEALGAAEWMPVLEYALELVDPGQPVFLRQQAFELCAMLIRRWPKDKPRFGSDMEVIGRFSRLMILLLVDEAEWLRNEASQMAAGVTGGVSNILPHIQILYFLQTILRSLEVPRDDSDSLIRLFHLIIEPFQIFKEEVAKVSEGDEEHDVEVFDKQENNQYSE